uniref:Transmembrane protein n=1 Tax=Clandestinovirus TaxID=2831644 RepID=A0A8F8KKU9_9VIRU|nr:transmembrane protein [Clandestinovirus]
MSTKGKKEYLKRKQTTFINKTKDGANSIQKGTGKRPVIHTNKSIPMELWMLILHKKHVEEEYRYNTMMDAITGFVIPFIFGRVPSGYWRWKPSEKSFFIGTTIDQGSPIPSFRWLTAIKRTCRAFHRQTSQGGENGGYYSDYFGWNEQMYDE